MVAASRVTPLLFQDVVDRVRSQAQREAVEFGLIAFVGRQLDRPG